MEGGGHVVCHNQIVGFGDAMKTAEPGARAIDFYGNEVLSAYDNGLELDYSEGNTPRSGTGSPTTTRRSASSRSTADPSTRSVTSW